MKYLVAIIVAVMLYPLPASAAVWYDKLPLNRQLAPMSTEAAPIAQDFEDLNSSIAPPQQSESEQSTEEVDSEPVVVDDSPTKRAMGVWGWVLVILAVTFVVMYVVWRRRPR